MFLGGEDTLGLASQLLTGWLVSGKAGLHGGRKPEGIFGKEEGQESEAGAWAKVGAARDPILAGEAKGLTLGSKHRIIH